MLSSNRFTDQRPYVRVRRTRGELESHFSLDSVRGLQGLQLLRKSPAPATPRDPLGAPAVDHVAGLLLRKVAAVAETSRTVPDTLGFRAPLESRAAKHSGEHFTQFFFIDRNNPKSLFVYLKQKLFSHQRNSLHF